MKRLVLFLVGLLCFGSVSYAETYYIDNLLAVDITNGTYSIAKRGGGGNDGNAYRDFKRFTLSSSFKHGDVCYVRGGIYDCRGNGDAINIQANNVVLSGYNDEIAVIDGSPGRDAIFVANAGNVTVTKLTVRNSSKKGIVVYGNVNNCRVSYCSVYNCQRAGITLIGEDVNRPKDCIVEQNTCYNNGWGWDGEAGISLQRLQSGNVIRYNTCYSNKQPDALNPSAWMQDGTANRWYAPYSGNNVVKVYVDVSGQSGKYYSLYMAEKNAVDAPLKWNVSDGRIYIYHVGDPGSGVFVCPSPSGYKYPDGNGITVDTECAGTRVYGNLCYGNGGAGINAGNSGNDGVLIYNNTCYNNGTQPNSWGTPGGGNIAYYSNRVGINISPMNTNIKVKNNIIFSNFQYNLCVQTYGNPYTPSGIEIEYNLYYYAGSANIRFSDSSGNERSYNRSEFRANTPYGGNDIEADPNCLVPGSANFRLNGNSPARNAGVDLSVIFNKDRDGTSLPQGPGWDIGAHEYIELKLLEPPAGLRILPN